MHTDVFTKCILDVCVCARACACIVLTNHLLFIYQEHSKIALFVLSVTIDVHAFVQQQLHDNLMTA